MKTFNQQICDIGREATEYIYESLKDVKDGIIFGEDDPKIEVTAFDFDGEAYTTWACELHASYIIEDEGNEVDYADLSNQSCARIADFVREYLNNNK